MELQKVIEILCDNVFTGYEKFRSNVTSVVYHIEGRELLSGWNAVRNTLEKSSGITAKWNEPRYALGKNIVLNTF